MIIDLSLSSFTSSSVRLKSPGGTGRVGGYENWRVAVEVLESFKGRLRKGDVIEYFHGAEAGLKKEYFKGEKIIFLLADYDIEKKTLRYSVLENSTLPYTADRVRKLRMIRRSRSEIRGQKSEIRARSEIGDQGFGYKQF
jgi:hypothetical protein